MENILNSFNQGMAEGFYKMFWQECGTHGITLKDKLNNLHRLSELSLRVPYWDMEEDTQISMNVFKELCIFSQGCNNCKAFNDKTQKCRQHKTLSELFPQLIPQNLCKTQGHTHLSKLSGLLLYVIHMEIFKEVKQLAENGKLTVEQLKVIQT